MKTYSRFFLLASLWCGFVWVSPLYAQDTGTPSVDSAPNGNTVITSDELRMDQESHTAVFSGNVLVLGTNFKMTCQEMTVIFDKDNKVQHIISTGDVVIVQPGRITHSGQAEYFHDEDKFVLTDQPTILDNRNQIAAPKIIIFRTKGSLYTEGRTTTTIAPGQGLDSSSTTAPADSGAK